MLSKLQNTVAYFYDIYQLKIGQKITFIAQKNQSILLTGLSFLKKCNAIKLL